MEKTNKKFTPETVKESKFWVVNVIRSLFCKHDYGWESNIYGDEIIAVGWKRSWWICNKCGKVKLKKELYEYVKNND